MIEHIAKSTQKLLIYAKDKNHKFIFCNDTLAEMAGVDSPKQILGKTDKDVFWRTHADVYIQNDKKVLSGAQLINVIEPIAYKEKILTLLTTKTILRNKKDEIYGVAGHSLDISGYSIMKKNGFLDAEKQIFHLGPQFYNKYFTRCELAVFRHLLSGDSVVKIASCMFRSDKTIQAHVKSIANKLQCSHKSEIVPTAIKFGLTYVLDNISLIKDE